MKFKAHLFFVKQVHPLSLKALSISTQENASGLFMSANKLGYSLGKSSAVREWLCRRRIPVLRDKSPRFPSG
jgi:hypothetical protein